MPVPPVSDDAPLKVVVRPLDLAMHEIAVEMSLPAEALAEGAVVFLPVWTPGSYLVRDYARFLDRMTLRDENGQEHPVRKLDKHRWQIPPLKRGAALSYRLFCNDLTVRTNHVDVRQAHLASAASFLALEGVPERPYEVRFEGWPSLWKVASALPARAGIYQAGDFDTLVDTPFLLGDFHRFEWEEQGAAFELVILGEHNGDEAKILEGTRRIVEVCGEMFGGFPFQRYVFLLVFSPGAGGGLEHRDCASLMADAFSLGNTDGYNDLFTLLAHEFFHAWNVKRMRASELGPFDYSRENPTRLLWFHEGFTSFMQYGLVLKAGLVPWSWVARKLANIWTEYCQRPGRLEQSLEEASFDAWIRHYKPTEFTANSSVSYYEKGAMIAWMMDAKIRLATGGEKGLEQFFQRLWQQRGDGPLVDGDLREVYAGLTEEDPAPFWRDYIQGRAELDAKEITKAYGLRFESLAPWEQSASGETAKDRTRGYTGITFPGDAPIIKNILPGSPAAKAGLSYGHEIIAVGGWRTASADEVQQRFRDFGVGDKVEVFAANRGRVQRHELELAENPFRSIRLVPSAAPSPFQRTVFQSWTGQPYPVRTKGRP